MGATHPATAISSRGPRRGPRRAIAVLAGGVIALGAAAPVGAGQFAKGHFHDAGEEVFEDFCGFDAVVHTFDVSGSFTGVSHQPDGIVRFRDSNRGTESFFNPETGRAYTHTFTFNGRDKRVTDNGDGTLTIIFQGSGTDKWHDGDGKLVLRGSGMFRDELRVDHNGTPSDPTDDGEPEFVRTVKPYQHDPFAGRDFCEDFLLFTA
jgi:hypothetical protein